jgi:hypothetical protein
MGWGGCRFFFFFVPPGHIIQYFPVQAMYTEPCTRIGIHIYRHSSALRASTAGRFRAARPATVVGKACFITFQESGLSPLDIVCMP